MSVKIKEKPIEEIIKNAPYDLPDGWRWMRLENVLLGNPQYGYTASAIDKKTDTKFLRITDIQNGNVQWENVPYCYSNSKAENYILAKDDMVFARTGATTGKTFLIRDDLRDNVIFASYLIRIRPNNKIVLPDFLNEFFKSHFYWMQIQPKGGANPNFNAQKLKKILIPLPFKNDHPDLETQKKIVAKIEAVFKKIEQAEKLRQTALEKSKITFDAVLNKIFKEADEGKNWKWIKLDELATTTSGGTPSRSNMTFWENGDIPWVKSGELNDAIIAKSEEYITEEGLKRSNAKIFPSGTLLMAMYGATVGKTGCLGLNATTNQAICAISPDETKLCKGYLWEYLKHKRSSIIESSFGGAQPNISQLFIKNLLLPIPYKNNLPDLHKQNEIVDYLDKLRNKIQHIEKLQTTQLTKFTALKESILNKAFRGELLWG